LNIPFLEGDDFHSERNIDKIINGTPLNDEDRQPWLGELNRSAKTE
jgi:carbohydrate kinase (thermoresistant glucokinase family)